MRSATCTTTLEGLDVVCTHCNVTMASHTGSGGSIRYFHCPSCQRWVSSSYTDVFRVDAKMRTRKAEVQAKTTFGHVKDRLENWLRSLDSHEPYRVLDVAPTASDETIRERYRMLARQHHPDRGGSADAMARINDAWDRISQQRHGGKQRHLVATTSAQ